LPTSLINKTPASLHISCNYYFSGVDEYKISRSIALPINGFGSLPTLPKKYGKNSNYSS
jgi:hypothetical protein